MFLSLPALVLALLVPDAVTTPTVPDRPAMSPADAAVRLSVARARFARTLDTAGWDRDRPEVRSVADALTAEAIEIAAAVPSLRPEAEALAVDLGGAPLGVLLHRDPHAPAAVIAAYLARRNDAALVRAAIAAGVSPRELALALASVGSPTAGAALAEALPAAGSSDQDALCTAALGLRPSDAQALSLAVSSLPATGVDFTGLSCVALDARTPAGRRRALASLAPQGPWEALSIAVALLLDGHATRTVSSVAPAPPSLVSRILAAAESPPSANDLERGSLGALASELGDATAGLALDDARIRGDLHRIARTIPIEASRPLIPVLLATHDPGLLERSLQALQNPHAATETLSLSLLAASAMLPPHDPAALARARMVFNSLAEQIRAFSVWGLSPRVMDLWVDALEAADRCRDDACLQHLLVEGTDESAARAAALLGARGLAALRPAVGAVVVRRVLLRDAPWLSVVVLTQIRGCPESLRSLTELSREPENDLPIVGVRPFILRLQSQCAR